MKWKSIINLLGIVIIIVSLFMFLSAGISLYYKEKDFFPFIYSFFITFASGYILYFFTKGENREDIRHREGFFIVTLSWITVAMYGSLPYMFVGTFDTFTDAYFESMAGFTTTGASVMEEIENNPKGILFWRSLTQWLGGMGIVVFSLAILPMFGKGIQLFKAEVPEITVEKLRPRLVDTAKSLWYIYTTLTVLAAIFYILGGMSIYDGICHAFTTLATGGFSTKNTSIAYFNSTYIDIVCIIFMFLAGINYTLYFFAFKGDFKKFFKSEEFRFYIIVTTIAVLLITFNIWKKDYKSVFDAFRYALFQVVSIMTTTGYATADYEKWSFFAQMAIITLMLFGGMIGSTGGGIKQVRVLLMFRQAYRELYQLIHPRAVTVLKLDDKPMHKEILGSVWGFLFLFIMISISATLIMGLIGEDLITSLSTVISALCNVGPALGKAGPVENYASLHTLAKWVLIFCMLVGRLEIYTVIILLVPHFWRK